MLVVISKSQLASEEEIRMTIMNLNELMQKHGSNRVFSDSDLLIKDWSQFTTEDYVALQNAGFRILDQGLFISKLEAKKLMGEKS